MAVVEARKALESFQYSKSDQNSNGYCYDLLFLLSVYKDSFL